MLPEDLTESLSLHLPAPVQGVTPVGGGCIHRAHRVHTAAGSFFVKYNALAAAPMFAAELKGLELLADTHTVPTPIPIASGSSTHHAFLLLQWVESGGQGSRFWEGFGQRLALLHRVTAPTYALDHHNYIGSLPQSNTPHIDWISFFIHERLHPQIALATDRGYLEGSLRRQLERLFVLLPELLPPAPPSLLHGDLWSGNFMVNAQGAATLIDPAVYYGHREAEIAFTRLFGGFHGGFYAAYHEAWPLEADWETRVPLFNLYPLMVHLNLFGHSYLPDIQETVRRYS